MFADIEGPSISFKNIKRANETNEIEVQTEDYELEIQEAYIQTNERVNGGTQTNVKDLIADESKNSELNDSKRGKLMEFLNLKLPILIDAIENSKDEVFECII